MKDHSIGVMLNEQLGKELFSSYLYLAIAGYYSQQNLDGFANWFEVQSKEELDHAMLFRKYLINKGEPVCLEKIQAPSVTYSDFKQGLDAALAHEQGITQSIHNIYAEALSCKDYQATQFLDWFIKEQGEEEKNTSDIIKKYDLFGSDAKGLYLLNAELLSRVYTAPSLVL